MPPYVPANMIATQVLDPSRPEELVQPIYDRANISQTIPSSIVLFSIPIGQSTTLIRATAAASVSKTERDTNLRNAGVIPVKAFQVSGISLSLFHADLDSADNARDAALILNNGYLKFRTDDKDLITLPLSYIPVVNMIQAVATTATTTTMNAYASPMGNFFKLNPQITLSPNQPFQTTLYWDGTLTLDSAEGVDIQVMFYAQMKRPT